MSIKKMLCVYDIKAEIYHTPIYQPTTASGIRAFQQACEDKQSQFSIAPEDFVLFEIGTFDDATCEVKLLATPTPVAKALDFVGSK